MLGKLHSNLRGSRFEIMIGSIRKIMPCEHLVSLGVQERGRERSVELVSCLCFGVGVGVCSKERSIQEKEGRMRWGCNYII